MQWSCNQARTVYMPHPLIPVPTPETQEFWDGLTRSVFRIRECCSCGKVYFPPSPICSDCSSRDVRWIDASGRGSLYSYTIQQKPAQFWTTEGPRSVALVRLEEGPLLVSSIVNCEQTPEKLKLDMKLKATFEKFADVTVLCFEPLGETS